MPGFRPTPLAVVVLLAGGTASAVTIRVPDDAPSLHDAVRRAAPGDRIEMAEGTYSPSRTGEIFPIELSGRGLAISGAGAGVTVLDAESASHHFVVSDGDSSTLSDFSLKGARSDGAGGALVIRGASPTLERLHFADNGGRTGGDALWAEGSEVTLRNCLFVGNGPDGPTLRFAGGTCRLEHVTLTDNGGGAIEVRDGAALGMRACIVDRPGRGGGPAIGLLLHATSGVPPPELARNLFGGCSEGALRVEGPGAGAIRGAIAEARRNEGLREGDPLFLDARAGDFRVSERSPARLPSDGRGTSNPSPSSIEIGAFGGKTPLSLAGVADTPSPSGRRKGATEGPGLLESPRPNPSNPTTTIRFVVRREGVVDLGVYNILGQRVRTLHAGDLAAGEHSRVWDGRDDRGEDLPPGIYFVHVTQREGVDTHRIALVR
jgi:hypothetical protein